MAEQGPPPGRSARSPGGDRPGREDRLQRRERAGAWRDDEAFAAPSEDAVPPWAGPDVYPRRPGGAQRPVDRTSRPPGQGRHGAPPPPPQADYLERQDRTATERYPPAEGYPLAEGYPPAEGYRPAHGQHAESGYPGRDRSPEPGGRQVAAGIAAADRIPAQAGYDEDADPGLDAAERQRDDLPDSDVKPPRRRGRRAAAARLRRSRRRVYLYCGTAIVIVLLIAGGIGIRSLMSKPKPSNGLVTSLQPGEYRAVPGSCGSVSSALLSQYLTASSRTVTKPLTGSTDSECTFTVDHKPVFRVLNITVQAFQPSALAAGNGGATENAIGNYDAALENLAHPPKNSDQAPAAITTLKGVGQRGFSALRVARGKIVTDLVTVNVQLRNVLVTVTLQGQESGGGFGPVSVGSLQAGALAAAKQVVAKVLAQQAVR